MMMQQNPAQIKWLSPKHIRAIQLAASLVLLVVIAQLVQGYHEGRAGLLYSQSENLTRALASQAAAAAQTYVINQDDEGLEIIATALTHHEAIYDVAIYDIHGILLATSREYQSLQERLSQLIHTDDDKRLVSRAAYIQEKGKNIGFVQLTVSYLKLQQTSSQIVDNQNEKFRLALLISLVIGLLMYSPSAYLIRAFIRFQQRNLSLPKKH